jgi:SNF family Na+-dependent transporter
MTLSINLANFFVRLKNELLKMKRPKCIISYFLILFAVSIISVCSKSGWYMVGTGCGICMLTLGAIIAALDD